MPITPNIAPLPVIGTIYLHSAIQKKSMTFSEIVLSYVSEN